MADEHPPIHCIEKLSRSSSGNGYFYRLAPSHPRADKRGRVYEHVLVVERALGHLLPLGAEVHHVDADGKNNDEDNLVACEDHAYHLFLHERHRAYKATGDAQARPCNYCREWGKINDQDFYVSPKRYARGGFRAWHKSCRAAYDSRRYHGR